MSALYKISFRFFLFIFANIISVQKGALAEYFCLCSYSIEKEVFSRQDTQSSILGYLYEFDCKPIFGNSTEASYIPVMFKNEVRTSILLYMSTLGHKATIHLAIK